MINHEYYEKEFASHTSKDKQMKHLKYFYSLTSIAICLLAISCSSAPHSSAYGVSSRNVNTIVNSHNEYDLDVLDDYITYTIDISTEEGRMRLQGLSKDEAANVAERQAAIKYKVDCIFDPKFDFLTKGKNVLRVTVAGRPANYKNSSLKKKIPENNVIIVK